MHACSYHAETTAAIGRQPRERVKSADVVAVTQRERDGNEQPEQAGQNQAVRKAGRSRPEKKEIRDNRAYTRSDTKKTKEKERSAFGDSLKARCVHVCGRERAMHGTRSPLASICVSPILSARISFLYLLRESGLQLYM